MFIILAFGSLACNLPFSLKSLINDAAANQRVQKSLESQFPVGTEFQAFFAQIDDPLLLTGSAISYPFTDPATGHRVQYFQKIRLEQTGSLEDPDYIVSPLGRLIQVSGTDSIETEALQDCSALTEEDQAICGALDQFYERHHGTQRFGKPISGIHHVGEKHIRYYENVYLIWNSNTREITLANLGETFLDLYEPRKEQITRPPEVESDVSRSPKDTPLYIFAAVETPFLSIEDSQTIYISVLDEAYHPVENANVEAQLIFPDGRTIKLRPPMTNQQGISTLNISPLESLGLKHNDVIQVLLSVTYQQFDAQERTWFKIWL